MDTKTDPQKALRLNLPKVPRPLASPQRCLALLLKRIARQVMCDVTECPPDTIPAHIARLDDLRDIIAHCLANWLAETPESRLSGAQLMYPATVADFAAAMQYTRGMHRAPPFINSRDSDLAAIHDKLDKLAGLFASSPALDAVMREEVAA